MSRLVRKIINYILEKRQKKLEKLKKRLAPKTYTNSTTKTHITASSTMHLTTETEKNKEEADFCIKNIIMQNLETPEKLLDYVNDRGTGVYKFSLADKILGCIKEEEGFITPLKGFKAFYLNIMLGVFSKKPLTFSCETPEMFVLRNLPVNIYYMIHQFHKWYGFSVNLPGYDPQTQEDFKNAFSDLKNGDFGEMSVGEIIAMKEAIARDAEAIDFVIKLAKEQSGSKKVLDKIKNDGSASI